VTAKKCDGNLLSQKSSTAGHHYDNDGESVKVVVARATGRLYKQG